MANQDFSQIYSTSQENKEIKDLYQNEEGFLKRLHPSYQDVSLDNCKLLPQRLVDWGRLWAKKHPLQSLFFLGTYGSGKTWFAHALIREVFKNIQGFWWPRIYTAPELDSKLLKASKSESGDSEIIRMIADEDLLMIDDFGRESKSERLKRQYFEIFNKRYINQKPTIITSNFNYEELSDLLDGAVVSRMQSWKMLQFPKKDLRRFNNIVNIEEL